MRDFTLGHFQPAIMQIKANPADAAIAFRARMAHMTTTEHFL
jgi:hypothetical protein